MELSPKKTRVTRYSCNLVKEATHLYNIPKKLNSPQAVYDYIETVMQLSQKTEEYLVVIYLDTKLTAIGYQIVSIGSLTSSIVHPREVYKGALLANAYSIMLVHNHPSSGDCTPSAEDLQITTRIKNAGEILGITLVDHVIIGDNTYYSFKTEHEL